MRAGTLKSRVSTTDFIGLSEGLGRTSLNAETSGRFLAERPPFCLTSVVFVAIDAPGFLVLLRMDGLAILFCQVTVILRAHTPLFAVDAGFLVFQARGLTCGQLPVLDAVGNAVLLVDLALVDVIVMCARSGCGLSDHRRGRDDESRCKHSRDKFHGSLLFLAAGA